MIIIIIIINARVMVTRRDVKTLLGERIEVVVVVFFDE